MALEEVKPPSIDKDLIDALTKKLREVGFLDADRSVSPMHPTFSKNPRFKGYSIDLMLNQFWTPELLKKGARESMPLCIEKVDGKYQRSLRLYLAAIDKMVEDTAE